MRRLGVRLGAILTLSVCAAPRAALADSPPVTQSYFSATCIRLVNTDANGVPAANGAFTVFVRDLANVPVAFSQVQIEFADCASPFDVLLQATQPQHGLTVDCVANIVRLTADEQGRATFILVGGARNQAGESPTSLGGCARVRADGVILGIISVAAFDQNGSSGLTPADIGALVTDLFSSQIRSRSDLSCSNDISPADLSLLVAQLFSSATAPLSGAFCDP